MANWHPRAKHYNYLKGEIMAYNNDDIADFVATLLHSGTVTHFMHLQTKDLGVHLALGDYYTQIIDLVDQFAEAYQGCYATRIKNYPETFHNAKDPVKYVTDMRDFVDKNRKSMPDETQLQNIIDEIAQLIDSTLYRLSLEWFAYSQDTTHGKAWDTMYFVKV